MRTDLVNGYLNMKEISLMIGKSYNYVRKTLKKNNIEPIKKELLKYKYVFYFDLEDVKKAFGIIEVEVIKEKHVYITETYHIYESKMNYIQDL
jgi:TPP-dependent indolepyruvate ferredoxin oxidoreductase alpha subunit